MSTAEPFMPAHEPRPTADPREIDIDTDVDVLFDEQGAADGPAPSDPPQLVHDGAEHPPFRTPIAGEKLTEAELEADLEADPGAGLEADPEPEVVADAGGDAGADARG